MTRPIDKTKWHKDRRCTPIFDEIDADLRNVNWRTDPDGYAVHKFRVRGDCTKFSRRKAHRVVLERILARPLTKTDICDHINFNRLDCRRENIRLVTSKQNGLHRKPISKSGYRGVTQVKSGKWMAKVKFEDKQYYCGVFQTAEEANEVVLQKRIELGFPS